MNNQQFLLRQISYSSLNDLRTCERKYQLSRFSSAGAESSSIDFSFGSAVGAGVQELWRSGGNFQKAALAAFFAWNVDFADEKTTTKKSIAFAFKAIQDFIPFYNILSQEWEIAILNGKPCVEFSLRVEFPDGFLYRAYVDLILRNKETEELATLELKTDGGSWDHEAKYKNSDQATSYTLILDHIEYKGAFFWAKYFVYYSKSQEWVPYDFPKALINKAKWIKTTLIDIRTLQERERENYFPMRGANCMAFGRPCKFFDICQLPDAALFAREEVLLEKVEKEKDKSYDFEIPLKEIVENYLSTSTSGD